MIYGVGADIIKTERIKNAGRRFEEYAFTKAELDAAGGRAESLAGNFAAKEAVSKAFGTGFRGFGLKDIEILRDKMGKPYVRLGDRAKEFSHLRISISISHEKEYAAAFAVCEEV